jgi:hypothetical protein
MEKVCVFCGERPESKSKEHVIPLWLIERTGDPRRIARFGVDFYRDPPAFREFSFDSLTFPACTQCNNDFSKLEENAKSVMIRLLGREPLSQTDLSFLLDWLDKVRVGLWLGYLYLDRNPQGIRPQYYISTRIGQTDRAVAIIRIAGRRFGINFIGPESPCFQGNPTCFALLINEFCFINAAGVSLCSQRLGFPYAQPTHLRDDSKLEVEFKAGTARIMRPVQRGWSIANAVLLHQPIFRNWIVMEGVKSIFDTDWVKAHSLQWENGYGGIFLEKSDSVREYPDAEALDWLPSRDWHLPDVLRHTVPFVYGRLIRDLKEGAEISGRERRKQMLQSMAAFKRIHEAMLRPLRHQSRRAGAERSSAAQKQD